MKLLKFPQLQQSFDYDCGAKALQAVLAYYGIEVSEGSIMQQAKTNPKNGTEIKNIIKTAKKYCLKCKSKKMTIKEIKKFIDQGIPVILVLQAWTEKKKVDWKNDWIDGHYVVAIGYKKDQVLFEDPSSLTKVYLEYNELEKRWHDIGINGQKYYHYGIAIYGKKPETNINKIVHMD